MHVILFSLGRGMLEEGSAERRRMLSYAKVLDSLSIIVFSKRSLGQYPITRIQNLTIIPTNSWTRAFMLVDALWIAACLMRKNGDKTYVLSAQDPYLVGAVAWLIARRSKNIFHVQVHGDFFIKKRGLRNYLSQMLKTKLALFVLHRAEGVRTVSTRVKRSLVEQGVNSEKISVLPIRPEIERFYDAYDTLAPAKRNTHFVFLAASRFSCEKNIPLMLRAFKLFIKKHPSARLRLIGRGKDEGILRTLITDLLIKDNVTILPWTEKLEREMAEADAFLLTSYHESYALTLVEAMAAGLPIITTDVGCVGELLHDGKQAIVLKTHDENDLARAMERLCTDTKLREQLSEAGRETARELMSITEEEYVKAWVATLTSGSDQV